MLGVLLAFRKLATSSELDVMRAVGLSYVRLLRVPYLLTLVMAAVNLAIVGYLQPLARYAYEAENFELSSGALGASIKVGEFTTLKDRMALRIEQSRDDGRRLIGIFARVTDKNGQVLAISASEGRFLASQENHNTIILRLVDGTIVQNVPGKAPRVLNFTQHDLPVDLPAIERFRARGSESREYVLPELLKLGWGHAAPAPEKRGNQANFNYRIAEVAMMFLLPLLALALAIPPKRSTSALGVFVSIILVVAYHKVNQYGQETAALGKLNPYLALWGPFTVVALLIVLMFYRVAFVPGGQAIGGLESAYAKISRHVKRLWRGKERARGIVTVEAPHAV
jgi:lipopolysaccharide export system permease protein